MRSKISTSRLNNHSGNNMLPEFLREQGVAMLATVLKSKVATQVIIKIMDAFVEMRKYISNDLIEHNKMLINHENRLTLLENTFDSFKDKNNHILFEGQIYDAYSLMIKILDILSKTNRKVILVTNKYNDIDYEKYKEQYDNVTLVVNNSFHDRFIILDKKNLYHSGASFKDLGKKCFAIIKIESEELLDSLLDKLM